MLMGLYYTDSTFCIFIAFIVKAYYLSYMHSDPVLQNPLKSKQSKFHHCNTQVIEELHADDKAQGQDRRQKLCLYLVLVFLLSQDYGIKP